MKLKQPRTDAECDLECELDKSKSKLTTPTEQVCVEEGGTIKCDFVSYLGRYIKKYIRGLSYK